MNLLNWIKHAEKLDKFELNQNVQAINQLDETIIKEFEGLTEIKLLFMLIETKKENKERELNQKAEEKEFNDHLGTDSRYIDLVEKQEEEIFNLKREIED